MLGRSALTTATPPASASTSMATHDRKQAERLNRPARLRQTTSKKQRAVTHVSTKLGQRLINLRRPVATAHDREFVLAADAPVCFGRHTATVRPDAGSRRRTRVSPSDMYRRDPGESDPDGRSGHPDVAPLYPGDDITDEDAVRAVRGREASASSSAAPQIRTWTASPLPPISSSPAPPRLRSS
jgi:trehalose-6-phosphatase